MAQLDYMEKRGSGLKRICNETKALESYKEERRPVFKSSPSQFMTVIYSVDYKDAGKEMGDGQLNGQLNGQLRGQLNDSQKETLEFIKTHEGYNTTRIADGLGKPFRTIVKHMNVLLELNIIERRGSKKTGGYYVK
ncbi:ATP-dependent DNA helicase RecG [Xylanibacter ruminicola]|uniref:ATP-dependent DNA helicase RecG n=2 Tax=Xylanibacter ruminicola TaxID=839 RepID=A0A1H4C9F5_XYLRU|nr:ATP-dependent DNA helicase RecG [Xylanibacter ruminicola]